MDFQELMLTYGYPILFLGVLLESEAFLLVGVYLAHRGYFSLAGVICVAALSSFVIAQLCYYLGHRYGSSFLTRRPRWQGRYNRVEKLMVRYGSTLVVGFRAFYGLRGAIPAAVGIASYPPIRFALLNAFGALLWAITVALAGHNLTQVGEEAFAFLHKQYKIVFMGIGIFVGLWGGYRLIVSKRLKSQ
ncbi:DedA family protein [Spirosoma endbachense]|uniref:DedA family protein n=1 Tax=Spirosoma endbachense TaxID=2666025 RepID=A0A6P1W6V6_9BACT|nr:DedA family protein [Spirosoma endbachense]QHW00093.1 DedA family protein [Spirosoma endbachense]